MEILVSIALIATLSFLYNKHLIKLDERERQLSLQLQKEKEARLKAIKLSNIDNMNGIEFEKYVAWLLSKKGYSSVEITKGSGDFGVDVIATSAGIKYSIQVKRYSSNVSRRAVSDAVAGKRYYSCTGAMVITNSFFTKQAKAFAESVNCKLVNRDTLVDWIQSISSNATDNAQSLQVIHKFAESVNCKLVNRDTLVDWIQSIGSNETDNAQSLQVIHKIPSIVMARIKKYAVQEEESSTYPVPQMRTIESEIVAYEKLRELKVTAKNDVSELFFKKIYAKSQRSNHASISAQLYEIQQDMEHIKTE